MTLFNLLLRRFDVIFVVQKGNLLTILQIFCLYVKHTVSKCSGRKGVVFYTLILLQNNFHSKTNIFFSRQTCLGNKSTCKDQSCSSNKIVNIKWKIAFAKMEKMLVIFVLFLIPFFLLNQQQIQILGTEGIIRITDKFRPTLPFVFQQSFKFVSLI